MSQLYRTLLRIEVERHFPHKNRGRPTKATFDEVYDGVLLILRTGMQWRALKPQNVSFITIFKTMHKWIHVDAFRTAYVRLLKLYCRKRRPKYCSIDSTYVKNVYGVDCKGRNPTDRGRMATKASVVVDDLGVPLSFLFTPANHSDMRLLEPTLRATMHPIPQRTELFADKGYDSAHNRNVCRICGMRDRLFKRKTQNSRRTHAKRGIVERFFSWLDKCRRLILRYERYVTVYASLTFLACGVLLGTRLQRLGTMDAT
jgi:transposase